MGYNIWSDRKVETWKDKNIYYKNCGFSKDEGDNDSVLENGRLNGILNKWMFSSLLNRIIKHD